MKKNWFSFSSVLYSIQKTHHWYCAYDHPTTEPYLTFIHCKHVVTIIKKASLSVSYLADYYHHFKILGKHVLLHASIQSRNKPCNTPNYMARVIEENFVKSFVDIWNILVKKEGVACSIEAYFLAVAFYFTYINANYRGIYNGKTEAKIQKKFLFYVIICV